LEQKAITSHNFLFVELDPPAGQQVALHGFQIGTVQVIRDFPHISIESVGDNIDGNFLPAQPDKKETSACT
jgi:hypothetical protein